MSKLRKKHDALMDLLDEVPGVQEHMTSFEVVIGQEILKRRIELGFTQSKVVDLIKSQGEKITQATISKVECGDTTVSSETYHKILSALGGISNIKIEFGELPKRTDRELQYA